MNNNQEEDDFFNHIEQQKEAIRLQKEIELKKIPSSQYICKKCNQKTVNYHLMSIRRHDEPGVTKFECYCGNSWKVRG